MPQRIFQSWTELLDPYQNDWINWLVLPEHKKERLALEQKTSRKSNPASEILSATTQAIWQQFRHNYKDFFQQTPCWESHTHSPDPRPILRIENPIVELLQNHSWFHLKSLTSYDTIWPANMTRTQREAVTLHTLLTIEKNLNETYPSPASENNMSHLLQSLEAEQKRLALQKSLMQPIQKKQSEQQIANNFPWWVNLSPTSKMLLLSIKEILTTSKTLRKNQDFLMHLVEEYHRLQIAHGEKESVDIMCYGKMILCRLPKSYQCQTKTAYLSFYIAKTYNLIHSLSYDKAYKSGINIQALLWEKEPKPEKGYLLRHLKRPIFIFLPKELLPSLEKLIGHLDKHPLPKTLQPFIIYHQKQRQLGFQFNQMRTLACNDNLLHTLNTYSQLHQHIVEPTSLAPTVITPKIEVVVPKLSNLRHKLTDASVVEFHIHWNDSLVKLRHTLSLLEGKVHICYHSPLAYEFIYLLAKWEEVLLNIQEDNPHTQVAYLENLIDFVQAYTWGTYQNLKTLTTFFEALPHLYILCQHLQETVEAQSAQNPLPEPDQKKHLQALSLFIQCSPPLSPTRTEAFKTLKKCLSPSEWDILSDPKQLKSIPKRLEEPNHTPHSPLREAPEENSTYTFSTPPKAYITLGGPHTPFEDSPNLNTSFSSLADEESPDRCDPQSFWTDIPDLSDINYLLKRILNPEEQVMYTKTSPNPSPRLSLFQKSTTSNMQISRCNQKTSPCETDLTFPHLKLKPMH